VHDKEYRVDEYDEAHPNMDHPMSDLQSNTKDIIEKFVDIINKETHRVGIMYENLIHMFKTC